MTGKQVHLDSVISDNCFYQHVQFEKNKTNKSSNKKYLFAFFRLCISLQEKSLMHIERGVTFRCDSVIMYLRRGKIIFI